MREMQQDGGVTPQERIRIVGIGKAGCGVINRIAGRWENRLATVSVHTHEAILSASVAPIRLQIGKAVTKGMGSGGDPETGRRAAEDDLGMLRNIFVDTDITFFVVGLGGGTGTGALPVLVKAAHDAGSLTLCFVTLPFDFEGDGRRARADRGLEELLNIADMTVVVSNQQLFEVAGGNTGLTEAFAQTDQALGTGIYAIWRLVSRQGLINVDFADLQNLARRSGGACALGYGQAGGENRAAEAANLALNCPMLGKDTVGKAAAILVSVVGGTDIKLKEINEITTVVGSTVRKGAHTYMGATVDSDLGDDVLVTIVASQHWKQDPDQEPAVELSDAASPAGAKKHGRKSKPQATQTDLALTTKRKGRFKDVEPTIFDGEDVDVPTFLRWGIQIDK